MRAERSEARKKVRWKADLHHVAANRPSFRALAARFDRVGSGLGLGFVHAEHLEGARERREDEVALAEFLEGVLAALAVGPEADPPRVEHLFVVLACSRALQALRDVVLEARVTHLEVYRFVVADEVRTEASFGRDVPVVVRAQ